MKTKEHQTDFCVVGGGLAGICATLAAARHGSKVVLVQDRPMLGGNSSSEIRMCVNGAQGLNVRETGIIEEILLENRFRNPLCNYSIWDSILYEKVRYQPNVTLLLNCSVNSVDMGGNRIHSVRGWQLTSETWHTVYADLFADCSGDSILAPLSGAEFRIGREARSEFNEDIEPQEADQKTMGLSCLIQARETDIPQAFTPPAWAYQYPSDDNLPYREHHPFTETNFWWIELGGDQDSIHDTEEIRDELLKVAFGVWDHIKNHGDHGAENWALDWIGFLPGKRESRRYVGDIILTQNDVHTGGHFNDLVAYGGWTMDDHHPGGMRWQGQPTIFHPAPSPFGIPYRCLYSRNIENLFCAGRNISTTHAALSASRVMATCAVLGQAVGTAAAIATQDGLRPRGVYEQRIHELQQTLMEDDCYIPRNYREVSNLSRQAALTASEGYPELLRNGIDRPVNGSDNGWTGSLGSWVQYSFNNPKTIRNLRLVFDSDLNRKGETMRFHYPLHMEPAGVPETMIRSFQIEAANVDGEWQEIAHVRNNYQRLVRIGVGVEARAVRFIPESNWGSERAHLFAFEVKE